jgi:hypothetical protein
MRIEILSVSFDQGQNHVVIILAFNLFAAIKGIPLRGYTLVNSANPL